MDSRKIAIQSSTQGTISVQLWEVSHTIAMGSPVNSVLQNIPELVSIHVHPKSSTSLAYDRPQIELHLFNNSGTGNYFYAIILR
jgi:hypothetical protein